MEEAEGLPEGDTREDDEELSVSKAEVTRDHAVELARFAGCELHNTSAVIGGVGSQEAVKVITHQYVPINNTLVYNGIAACVGVYEL
jgi:amyloid beta precursor protein binding protein 1